MAEPYGHCARRGEAVSAMMSNDRAHPRFIRWLALFWLVAGPLPLLLVLVLGGNKTHEEDGQGIKPARKVLDFIMGASAKSSGAIALRISPAGHKESASAQNLPEKR